MGLTGHVWVCQAPFFQFMGVGVQPYPRSPGSQRNQQSGLSQSSCFLPSPGNAWLGIALLLGRVSGPFVLGTPLKCLLPSSLPSDQPSPAHGGTPGHGVRNEFGSFLLLHGSTLRSPPFSPPFLPLTNVIWGHLGAFFPGEWGPPKRKHPQTHC